MSERKSDDLMARTRRPWTGEAGGTTVRAGTTAGEPQRSWLDRTHQPANPRHAAITRTLNSWSNYKSWTDKVRSSWDKDKSGK